MTARRGPQWIPDWARLRAPRAGLRYRYPLVSGVGLAFAWSVFLCWAVIVYVALVYWWIGLAFYWLVVGAVRGGASLGWWSAGKLADRRG